MIYPRSTLDHAMEKNHDFFMKILMFQGGSWVDHDLQNTRVGNPKFQPLIRV